ncbi:membrane protease YdiL (CAAX protease family) [Scopulibacillus daqui]|uniref:Membrane protease YdiL (CAAX protease family) n=1 Tax=Scopulibacillus daqui TaxID=1469162 RepID=A0ABS2Q4H3_9BACL|nr:type II CAAX endopeptidase family protein [Scopulibacillus daqui]MBM7646594.1 membrane protease YdiL (CAAX protease family) [Scopulibacillus daqui]
MPKRYWWILITYLLCQLSVIIPLKTPILNAVPPSQRAGVWTILTFSIALIVFLFLLKPEWSKIHEPHQAPLADTALWAFGGIFLVFAAQIAGGLIEQHIFGESSESENTKNIMEMAKMSPYVILVIGIIGPILEEIVFRKVIFGAIYKRTNFLIAGVISSLLFAFAHMDKHILVYALVGFVLCYLYKKSGRIVVSMFAHAAMNSLVIWLTFSGVQNIKEKEQFIQFIGGFIHG